MSGDCYDGTCATKHGPTPCDEGGGPVVPEGASAALLESMRTRNIESFRQLAAEYPKAIVINTDRDTVQIQGCKGAIIAHFPMDHKFISAVAD